MPIKVACRCGKSFAVKDQFAGKAVKCPNCGSALKIPQRSGNKGSSAPEGRSGGQSRGNNVAQLLDEAGVKATAARCPECREPMPADAVLCVHCGYHKELGRRLETDAAFEGSAYHGGMSAELALKRAAQLMEEEAKEQRTLQAAGTPWWIFLMLLVVILGIAAGAMAYELDPLLMVGILAATLAGFVFLAVCLVGACTTYNNIGGRYFGAEDIFVPAFGRALTIVFLALIVTAPPAAIIAAVSVAVMGVEFQSQEAVTAAVSAALPLLWVMLAMLLKPMLPTTYPKAMLIALLYYVVAIAIAAGIGAIGAFFLGHLVRHRLKRPPKATKEVPRKGTKGVPRKGTKKHERGTKGDFEGAGECAGANQAAQLAGDADEKSRGECSGLAAQGTSLKKLDDPIRIVNAAAPRATACGD